MLNAAPDLLGQAHNELLKRIKALYAEDESKTKQLNEALSSLEKVLGETGAKGRVHSANA